MELPLVVPAPLVVPVVDAVVAPEVEVPLVAEWVPELVEEVAVKALLPDVDEAPDEVPEVPLVAELVAPEVLAVAVAVELPVDTPAVGVPAVEHPRTDSILSAQPTIAALKASLPWKRRVATGLMESTKKPE